MFDEERDTLAQQNRNRYGGSQTLEAGSVCSPELQRASPRYVHNQILDLGNEPGTHARWRYFFVVFLSPLTHGAPRD